LCSEKNKFCQNKPKTQTRTKEILEKANISIQVVLADAILPKAI
jgi:hypothetical protein